MKEISTEQILLLAVQEKVFIILNAPHTLADWAAAIQFVSKSMLIECTEIHMQLCQLFNTFHIEDIIIRVFDSISLIDRMLFFWIIYQIKPSLV